MADAQRDFWPSLDVMEPVLTPLAILKEQAAALARKTKGLLEGRVDTALAIGGSGNFLHSFKIVAPTLDNYSYELFRVAHNVRLYPLKIEVSSAERSYWNIPAKNEDEFVDALKKILSSNDTMRVISTLLAQVQA